MGFMTCKSMKRKYKKKVLVINRGVKRKHFLHKELVRFIVCMADVFMHVHYQTSTIGFISLPPPCIII